MQKLFVLLGCGLLALAVRVEGQPGGRRLRAVNRVVTQDGAIVHLNEGPDAGLAWLEGQSFSTGTIEADIRGKDIYQGSFVGIAFHGVNDTTYEAIYFRPFNFRTSDTVRKKHAVQYIALQGYDWQRLRSEFPGKYEKGILPPPDPNDWFHVKIEVGSGKVRVFVNGVLSLEVVPLVRTGGGRLGYWVGNGSSGDWRGVKVEK